MNWQFNSFFFLNSVELSTAATAAPEKSASPSTEPFTAPLTVKQERQMMEEETEMAAQNSANNNPVSWLNSISFSNDFVDCAFY